MRPFNTVKDVTHRAVDALNLINELTDELDRICFILPQDMNDNEDGMPIRVAKQFKEETGFGTSSHPKELSDWLFDQVGRSRAVLAKAKNTEKGRGIDTPMSHADLTVMVMALANTLETAKFDINKELSDCVDYEMRKRLERLDMTITPVLKHFRRL